MSNYRGSGPGASATLEEVLGQFGIERYSDLSDAGGWISQNVVVSCNGRRYLLKRIDRRSPLPVNRARLHFRHRLIEHLNRERFPTPELLPCRDGRPFVEFGRFVYELYEFVEGESYTFGNLSQLDAVGSTLARFHDLCEALRPPSTDPWVSSQVVFQGLDRFVERCPEEVGRRRLPEVELLVESVRGRYAESSECLERSGLEEVIIHGDIHPGNVLFAADDVEALFDFDFVRCGRRIWDLSLALIKFAAPNVKLTDFTLGGAAARPLGLDPMHAKSLLESYSRCAPLQRRELELLPDQVVATFIERRCWLVTHLAPESRWKVLQELSSSLDGLRSVAVDLTSELLACR